MFTSAVVKRPCSNLVNGIRSTDLGVPDFARACRQHDTYIAALEACGLSVTILAPDEGFADSVFIEDTCLVTNECTVITRPGHPARRGETRSVAQAMVRFNRPVTEITAPGTLDAGDVMRVDHHFFVGLSDRTNAEGIGQLAQILGPFGYTVSAIALTSVLHLKTGVSYLENNCLLAWGEFVSHREFAGFTILSVDDDEAYAANSVWINDRVLVPEGFEKTRALIAAHGYDTLTVDVSEFQKLDGGLSCLSLRF
jgi:dimethylargininase